MRKATPRTKSETLARPRHGYQKIVPYFATREKENEQTDGVVATRRLGCRHYIAVRPLVA